MGPKVKGARQLFIPEGDITSSLKVSCCRCSPDSSLGEEQAGPWVLGKSCKNPYSGKLGAMANHFPHHPLFYSPIFNWFEGKDEKFLGWQMERLWGDLRTLKKSSWAIGHGERSSSLFIICSLVYQVMFSWSPAFARDSICSENQHNNNKKT